MARIHSYDNRPFIVKMEKLPANEPQYSFIDPGTFELWQDSFYKVYTINDLGLGDLGLSFQFGFAVVSFEPDGSKPKLVSVNKGYLDANAPNVLLAKAIYNNPALLRRLVDGGNFMDREADIGFFADVALASTMFEKYGAAETQAIGNMVRELKQRFGSDPQPGEEG